MESDDRTTVQEFKAEVNMTAATLDTWLDSDESRSAGLHPEGGGESIGHRSGRRIVGLLRKHQEDLTEDDLEHMRKVIGYIRRHSAQRPDGDVKDTTWRHSLMNWGHDPLKS